ncbi:MAG: hypothetical protein AAF734_13085 [Bacteroidota bacterium]
MSSFFTKYLTLFILSFCIATSLQAQEKISPPVEEPQQTLRVVDKQAQFSGGMQAFDK